MTARKRKKRAQTQRESSQVELLPELADATRDEAAAAEEAPDAAPAPEGPTAAVTDRWAKAVGRHDPARRADGASRAHPAEDGAVTEAPAEGGVENSVPRAVRGGLHRSARDHAAARVRPAGEPLSRAKDLVERGRVHEAIDLYLGILTVNAENLKAHHNLGVLLDELKQHEAALEHFEAAERLAPDNVEVLTNFASTLTSLARYDEAEGLLRRAQRLAAEEVQVRRAIGVLYFRRGLYSEAEAELKWVCARDEENGLAYYYRGEALNRLGRFDEALQAMDRAVTLLPSDPRTYYTLGHLYDRKHMPVEAAEMYRRARRLQAR